ncbi:hypothetical protein ACIGKQ_24970 [Gordonia sp. NPDC062954]|jgi:hypothetical protein|uniref:hypothetical protein n=1 Tax=Gordonia sp. NPDC062954 TaxID=3364003 RepID=UPI0037CC869B
MNVWIATKDPTKIAEVADRIAEVADRIAEVADRIAEQAPERLTEVDGDREFAVWLLGVDRKIRRYTGSSTATYPIGNGVPPTTTTCPPPMQPPTRSPTGSSSATSNQTSACTPARRDKRKPGQGLAGRGLTHHSKGETP